MLQISKERRKILVVKFIMGTASEISKVNHQIQASGMSCNLTEVKFIISGTYKKTGQSWRLENATNWDKKLIV